MYEAMLQSDVYEAISVLYAILREKKTHKALTLRAIEQSMGTACNLNPVNELSYF